MPPLVCCSPVIVDHSFPRNTMEMHMVVETLVKMVDQLNEGIIHFGITDQLALVIESIDWVERKDYPLLLDIHRFLQQLILSPFRVVRLNLDKESNYRAHPIPQGCEGFGLIDIWADEMGRLLAKHDRVTSGQNYFIGIACERAYSLGQPRRYVNPDGRRALPLVGPLTIPSLDDDSRWIVPHDISRRNVDLSSVFKNHRAIGSVGLVRPSSGSHYQMKFRGGRTWPLDSNIDPVSDRHLKELESITQFPLDVLKYALLYGELPDKEFKISS